MKKITLALVTLLSVNQAYAGRLDLTCEAYRVSKDENKNIQKFSLNKSETLVINEVKLGPAQWLEGDLRGLYIGEPVVASYKSKDGRGNYNVKITALSEVTKAYGRLSIGRDHDVDVYKVSIEVSRNNKTHKFVGTCTNESISTCGGACQEESELRDTL